MTDSELTITIHVWELGVVTVQRRHQLGALRLSRKQVKCEQLLEKGRRRKGRALLCCWVNPYLAHISHDMYSSGIPILQDLYEAWKDSEKHLRYNQCEKLILYQERLSWKPSVQTRDNLGKKGEMQLKSVKAVFVMEMFVRIHSLQRLQYKNYGHPVKLKGRRLRRNKKCFFIILHVVNLWTSFCRI